MTKEHKKRGRKKGEPYKAICVAPPLWVTEYWKAEKVDKGIYLSELLTRMTIMYREHNEQPQPTE